MLIKPHQTAQCSRPHTLDFSHEDQNPCSDSRIHRVADCHLEFAYPFSTKSCTVVAVLCDVFHLIGVSKCEIESVVCSLNSFTRSK